MFLLIKFLCEKHYFCPYFQSNSMMIDNAAATMEFNSIEQLDQGSSTLYTLTRY